MSDAIDYFSIGHPLARLRSRFAWRARERMYEHFLRMVRPDSATKVLDLGVTPDTTLPESNHFEQRYPWPEKITAASIENVAPLRNKFPTIQFTQITPGPLPFNDKEFDAVFCSAVLEHVGAHEFQKKFILEILRVSRSFFITTPYRWFPLEFHTILPLIHWLPRGLHQHILRNIGKEFWAQTSNLNLLDVREIKSLFPENVKPDVDVVRLFGWPSNLMVWGRDKVAQQ